MENEAPIYIYALNCSRRIWDWRDGDQSLGSKPSGSEHASASRFEPARLGPLTRPLLRSVVPQPTFSETLMAGIYICKKRNRI